VFAWCKHGIETRDHSEPEHMLRIMRNARCVPVTPMRIDRVPVHVAPIVKFTRLGGEAGFLFHFRAQV